MSWLFIFQPTFIPSLSHDAACEFLEREKINPRVSENIIESFLSLKMLAEESEIKLNLGIKI